MTSIDIDNHAWLHGQPHAEGILKQSPADFIVQEDLGFEPDGEGEHVLVYLRKTGSNTQFVADALARFARIAARSVSYAGLKDRHAITEQWFCLHLPGKETPDFSQFALDGCQIINVQRHKRKLRIGYLKGNTFKLILRDITDRTDVEQRLNLIQHQGVPNYFGAQRFGHAGNNLQQAIRWARDEIRVKERSKRSFYLSAVRSALFNQIVSARIQANTLNYVNVGDAVQLTGRGSWFVVQQHEIESVKARVAQQELLITAPLVGDGELGTQAQILDFENQQLAEHAELLALVKRERLEPARRAVLVIPQSMDWQWLDNNTLNLKFYLPAGCFATSVVRELLRLVEQPMVDLND